MLYFAVPDITLPDAVPGIAVRPPIVLFEPIIATSLKLAKAKEPVMSVPR